MIVIALILLFVLVYVERGKRGEGRRGDGREVEKDG